MKFFATPLRSLACLALLFTLFLLSCQKSGNLEDTLPPPSDSDATYADESARADAAYEDLEDFTFMAGEADNEASDAQRVQGRYIPDFRHLRDIINDCATVTVYPNDSTYPKTITIDFSNGCVGLDGKLRKGKVVIHLTNKLRRSGSVMTVTLVDYAVNGIQIEGTKVVTNLSQGNTRRFMVRITNGKVTYPNGPTFLFEKLKYRKQIAGMDTDTVLDNVFEITGWAKIRFANGIAVNIDVKDDDPLIKKVSCPWRSDGSMTIKVNQYPFLFDYGYPSNGSCDNKALLSWSNGHSHEVTLP